MRLFLLTALTMTAFAANSVLTRLALTGTALGPGDFAAIRLASGAVMLMALVALRPRAAPLPLRARLPGAAMLALYVLGFSFAYVTLDAGVGALLLFGGVQITMFAGALVLRESIPPIRWIGAGIAFAGLAWVLWPPGRSAPDPLGAALMLAAALGWGLYSLAGRGGTAPLKATAANFLLATPLVALAVLPAGLGSPQPEGIALAVVAGAVTSGLGYALWYAVLPGLGAQRAAVAQLTVPVIAIAAGALFLGERLSPAALVAAAVVLGGVALATLPARRVR